MSVLAAAMPHHAEAEDRKDLNAFDTRLSRGFVEPSGLTLGLSHTFEVIGGTHESTRVPLVGGLTDLRVGWRPKVAGVLGNGLFTATYSVYSQSRPSVLPDLQGTSNVMAEPFHHWREAYFETPLSRFIRIKIGKVDANTEFGVVEPAGDLSNASAGVSPTLFTMPSYPDGALSANVFVSAGYGISLGTGVYRSKWGGRYLVGELGKAWSGNRAGRVSFGIWNQSTETSLVDALPASSGSYVTVEQTIIRRGPNTGLQAFARFSTADVSIAPASMHNLCGASWTGFGNRRNDSVGFAFLHLLPTLEGAPLQAETALETYYKLPVAQHMQMKMDLQHVRRAGGLGNTPSYIVASLRVFMNFSTDSEGR